MQYHTLEDSKVLHRTDVDTSYFAHCFVV